MRTARGKRRIMALPMPTAAATLSGRIVRLEPLALNHVDELVLAAAAPEIWEHLAWGSLARPDRMCAWVEGKLADEQRGISSSFAIILLATGRVVGSTSYLDIAWKDRRVEIGSTWLTREVWRTAVNTECKYLLMQHAFETLALHRVQLKTDILNLRSQAAIARLGAVREGVLRAHMIRADGSQRDTVMFSVIRAEWPETKRRLEGFLSR